MTKKEYIAYVHDTADDVIINMLMYYDTNDICELTPILAMISLGINKIDIRSLLEEVYITELKLNTLEGCISLVKQSCNNDKLLNNVHKIPKIITEFISWVCNNTYNEDVYLSNKLYELETILKKNEK